LRPRTNDPANLYVELGPFVYRCCLRILRDRHAAEDATQEVFVRLLRNPAAVEEHRDRLLRWVVRVARNHCMNLRRDARQDGKVPLHLVPGESASPDPAGALLARRLLARFDPATQRAALAVLASGMSYAEAGAVLRLSPSTVARKVQRFLEETRTYLAA
jgi:RNA polymerase sigma-70 factor, ECF subfamily